MYFLLYIWPVFISQSILVLMDLYCKELLTTKSNWHVGHLLVLVVYYFVDFVLVNLQYW
jgi:hypothetical protein